MSEVRVEHIVDRPAQRPVASQLERLENGLDALLQSHAALARLVEDHDKWAKDYNVTVEARNQRVSELHEEQSKAHAEWVKLQEGAIRAFVEMFGSIEAKLQQLLDLQQKASKGHGKARPDRAVRQARGVGGKRAGTKRGSR